ncbi:MAG: CHAT domain-containing protein [Xenococcus sp. (in: cyanobacteria)]
MENSLTRRRTLNWLHYSLCLGFCTFAISTFPKPVLAQKTLSSTEITSSANQENLLNQGKIAYQAGRYSQATEIWQAANKQYQTTDNFLPLALSFNYLALSSYQQGNLIQAEQYLAQSLELLHQESSTTGLNIYAQALNTQGRLELAQGNTKNALKSWEKAAGVYRQAGDRLGILGSQLNQAQALQNLGLYRRSQKLLEATAKEIETQTDPNLKMSGLRSLGQALQVTGDLHLAQEMLEQSLAISQELNLPEESSVTLFSLGNVARALNQPEKAIAFYQQATNTTTQPIIRAEAQLNQLGLLIASSQWQASRELLPQIEQEISNLVSNPNRRSIYIQVNFAKNLIELSTKSNRVNQIPNLLNNAQAQAKKIKDTEAQSYAVGILGNWYETQQQWLLGQKYTQQALQLAQTINNQNLTYQWQWQLGRLSQNLGNQETALIAYTGAVDALESLRSDLAITNRDSQFSFRQSVEPVYRELVSLLLQPENNQEVTQAHLVKARDTIEALQLAELNDFFREACLDAKPTDIDKIDVTAAVIYPIILRDRLEVIISLPNQPLQHYSTAIPQDELEKAIAELRYNLPILSRRLYLDTAMKLYDWLIRPAIPNLVEHEIETLVFVPDGSFRNIPLAVLYDGEQYLVEQYNVSLTPGLQLVPSLPLDKVELKTLAAGITQQRRGFDSLEYVNNELQEIKNNTDSTILRDQEFTQEALQNNLSSSEFPIVHIATHGQFSSDIEETFILAWDSNIDIKQLNNILKNNNLNQQQSLELLVLSACETAQGDKRAALGLAGMAVRAGARTTLATLWTVSDESTALTMNSFYEQLTQPNIKNTKAQALRQAQLKLINSDQFNHPFYWAPFVMIGNWL